MNRIPTRFTAPPTDASSNAQKPGLGMQISRPLSVIGALLLLSLPAYTSAYTFVGQCGNTPFKWSTNSYQTRAHTGLSIAPWRNALSYVVNHWYGNPSNFRYGISFGDTNASFGNDQNEMFWTSGLDDDVLAQTAIWYNSVSCRFLEADILFNVKWRPYYTTSTQKTNLVSYGGNKIPFQTVAMHEFGHTAGLGETANTYSAMGTPWTHIHANGATARAYHGEDAASGVIAIYGLRSSAPKDLGVTHWRRTGSVGVYSTHGRTRVFNCAGGELPKVAGTNEPLYRVNKGQCVQLELTYENMGRSSPLTPRVAYFLSRDALITTTDKRLTAISMKLPRDRVYTYRKTLTIPNNLTTGKNYWLGAVIDPAGRIEERYEWNNASYVGIRVN